MKLPIIDLSLSENGKFALARTAKRVYHWPLSQTQQVNALAEGGASLIYNAVLSPNGQFVLSSYSDHQVKLWEEGQLSKNIPTINESTLSLAFGPDNNQFLIGYERGLVQLWTKGAQDWNLEMTFPPHRKLVDQLAFNENASFFISVGHDHYYSYSESVRKPNSLL